MSWHQLVSFLPEMVQIDNYLYRFALLFREYKGAMPITTIEYPGGGRVHGYWQDGAIVPHKLDGPAVEGGKWKDGKFISAKWRRIGLSKDKHWIEDYDASECWEWRRGGKRHRADGPAVQILETEKGKQITTLKWCSNGLKHREGGPAIYQKQMDLFYPTVEEWWRHGRLHRSNGPALVHRSPYCGNVIVQEYSRQWYDDGVLHRNNDQPASIVMRYSFTFYYWYCRGKLHRDPHAAVICKKDKKKIYKEYYTNGALSKIVNESEMDQRKFDPPNYELCLP